MKAIVLIFAFIFSSSLFADEVPAGCPTDDPQLQDAVANGQQIACQIEYYTGGHGGQWVKRPISPNAKPTIELACIDAQNEACPGLPMCYDSSYFDCAVAE